MFLTRLFGAAGSIEFADIVLCTHTSYFLTNLISPRFIKTFKAYIMYCMGCDRRSALPNRIKYLNVYVEMKSYWNVHRPQLDPARWYAVIYNILNTLMTIRNDNYLF